MRVFPSSNISKLRGSKPTLDQHPIQGGVEILVVAWLHDTETKIGWAARSTGLTHTLANSIPSDYLPDSISLVHSRQEIRQKPSIHNQMVFWSSFVGENSTDRTETGTKVKRFLLVIKCKRMQLFSLKGDVVVTIVPFQSGNYFFSFGKGQTL